MSYEVRACLYVPGRIGLGDVVVQILVLSIVVEDTVPDVPIPRIDTHSAFQR